MTFFTANSLQDGVRDRNTATYDVNYKLLCYFVDNICKFLIILIKFCNNFKYFSYPYLQKLSK